MINTNNYKIKHLTTSLVPEPWVLVPYQYYFMNEVIYDLICKLNGTNGKIHFLFSLTPSKLFTMSKTDVWTMIMNTAPKETLISDILKISNYLTAPAFKIKVEQDHNKSYDEL